MDRGVREASGRASPLGARRADGGTNFSVWSRTAAQVVDVDDAAPSWVISLDPLWNRTSYFWHVLVPGGGPGQGIVKLFENACDAVDVSVLGGQSVD